MQSGQFRADLFYRLSVFSITLPALRERRDDILPLARHFLAKYTPDASQAPQLSTAAVRALLDLRLAGECAGAGERPTVRAVHLARDGRDRSWRISACRAEPARHGAPMAFAAARPYKAEKAQVLEAFERQYITRLMTEHKGNVSRAAQAAGKERRDLGKLLKRHGVDPRAFAA